MTRSPGSNNKVNKWFPPTQNNVKINVDAHIKGNAGVAFGVAIRDGSGNLIAAAVKTWEARWTSDMAETGAARYGLEVARRLGYDKVILESDASNVVKAINHEVDGVAPIFLIFDDCIQLSKLFSSFKCIHIGKKGNTVAHAIARWETSNTEHIWLGNFSQSILTLVDLDLV